VWNNVLDRCSDKNVYLTWEYLSTYLSHFRREIRLRTLCVEDNNKIIGIAPLRQSRYGFVGPLSYNVIEPLGVRGLMLEGADYTGLILAERKAECLRLIINHLYEHDDWDFMYMYSFSGASMIPDLLSRVSDAIPPFKKTDGIICPYMAIPNSVENLMRGLSKNFRYNLRRYMKKLERDYQKVEFKKYDELGSVQEAMTIFFELHQKRWKAKNMPGVFASQESKDFWLDVAKCFAAKGWLALYFLTARDKPIGALLCYEYDKKMYSVLPGFDPDYSEYRVGQLMHQKITEKCVLNNIKEFDFLKGDEPYKFDWTKKYRRTVDIRFVNERFTSNLYDLGIRTIKKSRINKQLEKSLTYR
jgi:hypothetical protein